MPFSRRANWYVGLVVAFVVLLAAVNWAGRRRIYHTVESVGAELDAAGIGRGTPSQRVLAVLDSLNAKHSDLAADGTIGALIGPSSQNALIRGDIRIEFRFDSTQRLVARNIREIFTGP